MLRALGHCSVFLLGLLGTAALVAGADRMPFRGWTRPKIAHAVANAAAYDTLAIGSSRVNFGFQPEVFDARMRDLGCPTTTFNVALSGFRTHDFLALGEWLVRHRHPRLRTLIVEIADWDPGEPGGNWYTDLQIPVHTLRGLPARVRSILDCNPTFAARAEKLRFALGHTLVNTLGIGQGPRIVDDLWRAWRGEPLTATHPVADAGFQDIATTTWEATLLAHAQMVADPSEALKTLADKLVDPEPVWMHGRFNLGAWERFDALCRAAGVEPVYVAMPGLLFWLHGRDQLKHLAERAIVVDFDDPRPHRALHELQHWFDRAHLARSGAEIVSTGLADAVAPRLLPLRR